MASTSDTKIIEIVGKGNGIVSNVEYNDLITRTPHEIIHKNIKRNNCRQTILLRH